MCFAFPQYQEAGFMANGQAGRCQEMKSGCKSTKWSNTKINKQKQKRSNTKKGKNGHTQKKYKMVKDMYKQTKAQDDQAQKERNKSTKWSKTKINKQRDKMVKYNPQIQTHDVYKKYTKIIINTMTH